MALKSPILLQDQNWRSFSTDNIFVCREIKTLNFWIHSIKSLNTGYTADPSLIVETKKVAMDLAVQQYQLGKILMVVDNKGDLDALGVIQAGPLLLLFP